MRKRYLIAAISFIEIALISSIRVRQVFTWLDIASSNKKMQYFSIFLVVLVLSRFAGTRTPARGQRFPDVVQYEYHFVEHKHDRCGTQTRHRMFPWISHQGSTE